MEENEPVEFQVASLKNFDEEKLNEITDKVLASEKGSSAMRSMMRSVMRSALRSTLRSVTRSPER